MIEINDLVMKYSDNIILNKINLQIDAHETCAIIGPSGCGKSTLLYGLAGIVKPASGSITIDNSIVVGNRKETGVILQTYGLMPWKTVWENASLGLSIRGVKKNSIEEKISIILKQLHIYDLRDQYPVQLSGGQRQRVAIARALSIEPDLLLMDEPFSSLDAIAREELQNVVVDLYNQKAMTTIIVTHSIEEAVFLGQKIIIMDPTTGNIKKTLDNHHFGDHAFRNTTDFHKTCVEVRKLMEVTST
ncbi:ABC transporter ATP-binding protein [Paraliobacillus quinghaiensis]|uniref:ABC transporter ATP-binding protein n=1 Tax=Paraliobacillus quinghaiensis TaxID=470815 RepID=A0A917TEB2_9BACI|nr:ABC transporter ATP-binding protein [Paraliobacillus quinghaiensis]GGM19658.1 ABC transporter ATP-binding protein [Paraliobacillus quinghaiensis]